MAVSARVFAKPPSTAGAALKRHTAEMRAEIFAVNLRFKNRQRLPHSVA
jgi:hypothetical protein